MRVYYDEGRTYQAARLHPFVALCSDKSGSIDFKMHPEKIPEALEDFREFASTKAVQTFYSLLRWINGPDSYLETCDCAFRPPAPYHDQNSSLKLSAHGRLFLMFRGLRLNCSTEHTDWLCGRLMKILKDTDATMTESEGVVGFTFNPAIHTQLSKGFWRDDGQFDCAEDDPGHGRHLMLSFWSYGNNESQVVSSLDRVFRNIWASSKSLSTEIGLALNHEQPRS